MAAPTDPQTLTFDDAVQWQAWLADHHQRSSEVWLVIAKKGFETAGITIGEALDAALCFGWIDSHRRGRDRGSYLQRYSPRRSKSPWSALNVERAEALIQDGRMQEAGRIEIAAAQADGRWTAAYEPQAKASVPADVTAAFAQRPRAAEAFEQLSKSARYALILPILKAVAPETRARRLQKAIETLEAQAL